MYVTIIPFTFNHFLCTTFWYVYYFSLQQRNMYMHNLRLRLSNNTMRGRERRHKRERQQLTGKKRLRDSKMHKEGKKHKKKKRDRNNARGRRRNVTGCGRWACCGALYHALGIYTSLCLFI